MKLILGVSALTICTVLGFKKSGNLTKNVNIIDSLILFFTEYRNKVEYTEETIFEIIEFCAEDSNSEFIFKCKENMKKYDFPEAWKKAVAEMPVYFPESDRRLLNAFGNEIGTSDKRTQMNITDYMICKLKNSLQDKKEKEKKSKKLYAFCGVAIGLVTFIMLL